VEEREVYQVIGAEGFSRLAAAFYRQVPDDGLLGPMYPKDDLEGAEQRLRDFLIYRFGGPPVYTQERGHPRLRMRHAGFPINQAARDRWIELMCRALDQAALDEDAKRVLGTFFAAMATFMINRTD
jgi:hemoglobin